MSLYVFVLLLFLILTTVNAQLTGKWPEVDKPPPVNDEWTKLVDQSKLPNAPLTKVVGNCGAKDNFCNWSCTQCIRNDTDITECPSQSDWGLTFDDGPTEFTPALLDYLAANQLQVTFFVIGSRVYDNPQTLQRAISAGHQIGVHTWSHTALTTQTNEEIIAEIKWTELAIKQAGGVTPRYMRPPYGDVDDRVRGILTQLGYKVVIWDKDTNDWMSGEYKNFQIDWVEGNFTEWVKESDLTGHISLEHDLYQQSAAQAPKVVPIVQGAGFSIKPVAVCIGDTKPYLESQDSTTNLAPAPAPAPTPNLEAVPSKNPDPEIGPSAGYPSESSAPTTTSSPSSTSNAISFMNNNNNYLLLLLFFIVYLF